MQSVEIFFIVICKIFQNSEQFVKIFLFENICYIIRKYYLWFFKLEKIDTVWNMQVRNSNSICVLYLLFLCHFKKVSETRRKIVTISHFLYQSEKKKENKSSSANIWRYTSHVVYFRRQIFVRASRALSGIRQFIFPNEFFEITCAHAPSK